MAKDVTTFRDNFGSTELALGITIERLILVLYPSLLIPVLYFWFSDLKKRRLSTTAPAGCQKLGITNSSNAEDEYDSVYDEGTTSQSRWKIKALYVHPVKSCAAVELNEADIDAEGMTWDRKFAFAELLAPTFRPDAPETEKKPKWTFRTLRQPGYEKMALIKPEVWLPGASSSTTKDGSRQLKVEKEGALIIRYPNVPYGPLAVLDRLMIRLGFMPKENSFRVPLIPPDDHNYALETVNIWRDNPMWLNYSKHIPDDFRHWIGAKNPITLFRADPKSYREVYRCAPRRGVVGYQPVVGFQDAYPLHLLNLASVHDVGKRVKDSIPRFSARRFRANILLQGPPAYDEDDWKRIRLGGNVLICACHTVRCRLPNVDPDSSERHSVEPDKTLKSFRCIDDGDPKNACLGLQLVPSTDERIHIKVGDSVEVLERGEHHYIKQ